MATLLKRCGVEGQIFPHGASLMFLCPKLSTPIHRYSMLAQMAHVRFVIGKEFTIHACLKVLAASAFSADQLSVYKTRFAVLWRPGLPILPSH